MKEEILDSGFSKQNIDLRNVRFAGFWIRVVASFLDTLVLSPLIFLMFYNMIHYKMLAIAMLVIVAMSIYKPFMEYQYGATLGKMAVSIKVVDQNFENIDLNQAIIRYSPWIIVNLISIYNTFALFDLEEFYEATDFMTYTLLNAQAGNPTLGMISSWGIFFVVIVVAFNTQKQGLHDMMAKTYCVYKDFTIF